MDITYMLLSSMKCINYTWQKQKKGRSANEVKDVISWLTGYSEEELQNIDDAVDMETFFTSAPRLHPNRNLIKGSVCGVKISEIEEPIMKL